MLDISTYVKMTYEVRCDFMIGQVIFYELALRMERTKSVPTDAEKVTKMGDLAPETLDFT